LFSSANLVQKTLNNDVFVVSLRLFRHMPVQYLEMGHDRFLPHPYHPVISYSEPLLILQLSTNISRQTERGREREKPQSLCCGITNWSRTSFI